MSEKRKRYSATEKAKIALEAIKSELTLAQITSKYGVHTTQRLTCGKNKHSLICLTRLVRKASKKARSMKRN